MTDTIARSYYPTPAQSIRMQEIDDLLESLEGWRTSHGRWRAYWRQRVRYALWVERRHKARSDARLAAAVGRFKHAAE